MNLNVVWLVLFLCSLGLAENKGFCPPPAPTNTESPRKAEHPASTDPDKKYFGTVTVLTVVSDTSYVCSARITHGLNKELDKKTALMVKGWHLDPARKNGKAVPAIVSLDVNYWTTSKGEIVTDTSRPRSSVPSAEDTVHY